MKKHLLFLCICVALVAGLFSEPLSEGFEGTWPPTDWTNSGWELDTYGSPHSGDHFAYSDYATTTTLTTPSLFPTDGDNTFSFWYCSESSSYLCDLEVYVNGNLEWSETGFGSTYQQANVDLSGYNDSAVSVEFKYDMTSYYGGVCLDDVSGPELFVPEFPAPTALVATDITQTTANLGWTENGTATSWNIEWGEAGFTLGEGTSIPSVTTNPYNLSGLTGGTNYEFYVQTTDPSDWSAVGSFTTMPPAQSFPLTEDFESGLVKFGNASGNNVDWAIDTTIYHGGVQSVGNPYGVNNENILHETGILDLSSTTAPILKFWQIAKTEGEYDKCYVEISTDGGATYAALPAAAYQGSGSGYATAGYFDEDDYATWGTSTEIPDNTWWKEETFNLSAYNVADVRLRFRLTSDGSAQRAGWYLDDIEVKEQPTNPVFSVDPASKDFGTVSIGVTSDVQTFTITNTGGGTLTIANDGISIVGAHADQFSLTDENVYPINLAAFGTATVDVAFAPASTGTKTANLHIVDNLSETDHDVVLTGEGFDPNSGGGGAAQGNYYFANSLSTSSASKPAYNWIDYSGHTQITDWTDDGTAGGDDSYFTTPIGFDFTFFGNSYSEVHINSNGALVFGVANSYTDETGSGLSIPGSTAPNDMIAGCMMDLDFDTADPNGAFFYGGDAAMFVVTFYHLYDYGDATEWMTFQIILYPSGNIKIQYNDTESTIDPTSTSSTVNGDALIGIENAAGDAGIQYRNDGVGGPIFGSDLALMFGQDEGALPVTLTSFTATVAQETTADIQWTVESESGLIGYYVYRSDSDYLHANAISELIVADNTPFSHSYSFIDNELEYEHSYRYWLESVGSDGTTHQWGPQEVVLEGAPAPQLPEVTELATNYPNPFNPVTVIKLNVKENEKGMLEIFNTRGQLVMKKTFVPGYHEYEWDARGNASGLYFYRLSSQSYTAVKKMMLLK